MIVSPRSNEGDYEMAETEQEPKGTGESKGARRRRSYIKMRIRALKEELKALQAESENLRAQLGEPPKARRKDKTDGEPGARAKRPRKK
jgi:50S ribosomal subunit-associated GTPase HflX